jgi:transcription initiation factor TFIIE subunit alpha
MRLTDKKIEEVVRHVVGDDILPLIKKLRNKENVSEFKLADQLKEDIKRVRNMLYRLYEVSLVSFTRKKDKKKGWYIYYWTFKPEQIKFLYVKIRKNQLERLQERLKNEQNEQFFICQNECVRLNFEQAMNFEFGCPECGELTEQIDISKKLKEMEKKVEKLKKELKIK